MDFMKLTAPFSDSEIEWRIQKAGIKRDGSPWAIVVPYIDSRAVQRRLDDALGPENWQSKLIPCSKGMIRELSVRVNNEWITKADGADETDFEAIKGACSKSLVRVAVLWGVGRYLYDTPTCFARFVEKGTPGAEYAQIDNQEYYWIPSSIREPEPSRPSSIPTPIHATSTNRPAPMSIPKEVPAPIQRSANDPGEVMVPFGSTQGTKLKDLKPSDIIGLEGFYQRVPKPDGKAKTFKPIFEAFLVAINWEKKNLA